MAGLSPNLTLKTTTGATVEFWGFVASQIPALAQIKGLEMSNELLPVWGEFLTNVFTHPETDADKWILKTYRPFLPDLAEALLKYTPGLKGPSGEVLAEEVIREYLDSLDKLTPDILSFVERYHLNPQLLASAVLNDAYDISELATSRAPITPVIERFFNSCLRLARDRKNDLLMTKVVYHINIPFQPIIREKGAININPHGRCLQTLLELIQRGGGTPAFNIFTAAILASSLGA